MDYLTLTIDQQDHRPAAVRRHHAAKNKQRILDFLFFRCKAAPVLVDRGCAGF